MQSIREAQAVAERFVRGGFAFDGEYLVIGCRDCLRWLEGLIAGGPTEENLLLFLAFYCRAYDMVAGGDGEATVDMLDMVMNALLPDDFYNAVVKFGVRVRREVGVSPCEYVEKNEKGI